MTAFLLAAPEGDGGGLWIIMVQLALIFLIFYWLLIRPQRKEQERHREMVDGLRKGDEITTAGGIVGTIVHLTDDRITLKTGENTRIVVERSKVGEKLGDPAVS